jgi:hypothetical protein
MNAAAFFISLGTKEKFTKDFQKGLIRRFEYLSDRDIKDSDTSAILGIIRDVGVLFEELSGKEGLSAIEDLELETALKILRCPFLEKKLKVLNDFKDFIERAGEDL